MYSDRAAARHRASVIVSIAPLLGLLLLVAFGTLGTVVSKRAPLPIDLVAHRVFYGHGTALAAVLTEAGRLPAYVLACVVVLAFGLARRAWRMRAATSVGLLIAADVASNAFKDHFARARPPHQLIFTETSYAYASGHAALATAFYGGLALYAVRSRLPRPVRLAVVAVAALAILCISWSRLALGAHWLTDVLGGWLLGSAFVALQAAIVGARPGAREVASTGQREVLGNLQRAR